MRLILTIFTFFYLFSGYSQFKMDSIYSIFNDEKEIDSNRINALYSIGLEMLYSNLEEAPAISSKLIDFSNKKNNIEGQGKAHKIMAYYYEFKNNIDSANLFYRYAINSFKKLNNNHEVGYLYEYNARMYSDAGKYDSSYNLYHEAMFYYKKTNDLESIGNTYNDFATIEKKWGDHITAFKNYKNALNAYEKAKDLTGVAMVKMNMGSLVLSLGDTTKALKLYFESLDARKKAKDPIGLGFVYNNIALIYKDFKKYDMALAFVDSSYTLRDSLQDASGVLSCNNTYASIYYNLGQQDKAEAYWKKALELKPYARNPEEFPSIYINLGILSAQAKNYNQATIYLQKGLEEANELHLMEAQLAANMEISMVYEKTNAFKKALYHFKTYKLLNDSLNNSNKVREVTKMETSMKFESQIKEDSLNHAISKQIQQLELEKSKVKEQETADQKKMILWIGVISGAFLFVIVLNLWRNNQRKKRDNDIITEQKQQVDKAFEELEEKNTEIMDSIKYAKRIQSAILPPNKIVKEYLQDSFILYKPKDIVAGDFYWMEVPSISTRSMTAAASQNPSASSSDIILFAAADCTGHGVPGAMVSVVCNNGLNRSVREHGLTDPGKILDKTREIVIAEFEKSEEEVKDGMDIALCSLTFNVQDLTLEKTTSNLKSQTVALLQYAGAHNPLWVIRHGSDSVEEIKADKQPIGKFDKQTPYHTHTLELQKGDTIYIFSDGYVDQFGGEKGKKFKSRAFRELLLSIQDKSMQQQNDIIDQTFENWKGDLEQIDDVCVIGVRV